MEMLPLGVAQSFNCTPAFVDMHLAHALVQFICDSFVSDRDDSDDSKRITVQ